MNSEDNGKHDEEIRRKEQELNDLDEKIDDITSDLYIEPDD